MFVIENPCFNNVCNSKSNNLYYRMRHKTSRNLESIYKLFNLSEAADEVVTLSSSQKTGIRKGLKDIEEGRIITHSKVKKAVAKWFSIFV